MQTSVFAGGGAAALFRVVSAIAIAVVLLSAEVSTAEDESPLAEVLGAHYLPVSEDELSEARGRAILPDGLTVEVSVLMTFLVDGQEFERSLLHSADAALHLGSPGFPFVGSPPPLENGLNDVALEHYQQIDFHISNLPISIRPQQFVPPAFVPGGLIP